MFYPFDWHGKPENGQGTRAMGPCDCFGLTDVQRCSIIEGDVSDPDINGNYIPHLLARRGFLYRDPVTNELYKVYSNPVDSSINCLNVPSR